MARKLLSADEINQFIILLREVFTYITDLKESHALAADIQYPKLPPKLSESIAIHLLQRGVIPQLAGCDFRFGGNAGDILAFNGEQPTSHIEVKGTTKGFEYFGEKDVRCDYLLWFDFEDIFRGQTDHFSLHIVSHPNSYFDKPVKIGIGKLKRLTRDHLISIDYKASELLPKLASRASSEGPCI
jgi:hypothetical protein